MMLSVKIEDGCSSETHPVTGGMLCDGMNTVNPRLLSRIAEAVLRMRASGECETITVSIHPYGCPHGVVP
jgi:hypothetical protein